MLRVSKTTTARSTQFLFAIVLGFLLPVGAAADYSQHPAALALIDEMVVEHNFDRAELNALFSQIEMKQSIIDAMTRPAEKTKSWGEYRNIFIQPSRIAGGVAFWRDNAQVLAEVESRFGVPPEIVVAIIGVETLYGGNMGSYRVTDALATLAFDYPPRSPFFTDELKHFLILTREHDRVPLDFVGSYAGAMGLGQFMPSSYRNYALNYDADPFADIWTTPADAVWRVANYLQGYGWVAGKEIAGRAKVETDFDSSYVSSALEPDQEISGLHGVGVTALFPVEEGEPLTLMELQGQVGTEYWIGTENFYVITRYNHSRLYAMAVYQLASEINRQYLASQ